ncbi:MAG: glycosyltransferase [Candidatus Levybacteria bacterium]|nr:glycosyltransferase [Candidatus Levybacteria bacterium]
MKNNKLPTVTVAVSAYNEEGNIREFLRSVLDQKEEGFKIEAVWVHNDGSSDSTAQIVRSFKNPKIRLFDHKKRAGKATWLNRIYKDLKSDFLVQSDADVIFTHKYVVRDMVKPLIDNPKVGMTGGSPEPIKGDTFWEKISRVAFEPYKYFRSEVRGGDNIFSAVGQMLAFRKEAVKKIKMPEDMLTNDIYTYFCCLTLGYKYKYAESARVVFRAPQNLSDIIKQNVRNQIGYKRMYELFDPRLVAKEFEIPKAERRKRLVAQIIKYPLHATVFYFVNNYCILITLFTKVKIDAKWPMAESTKKLI